MGRRCLCGAHSLHPPASASREAQWVRHAARGASSSTRPRRLLLIPHDQVRAIAQRIEHRALAEFAVEPARHDRLAHLGDTGKGGVLRAKDLPTCRGVTLQIGGLGPSLRLASQPPLGPGAARRRGGEARERCAVSSSWEIRLQEAKAVSCDTEEVHFGHDALAE